MPCDALVCKREADCGDTSCPGHPKGVAAYLDEMDRQSAAHHAAMNRRLDGGGYWPREQVANAKPRKRFTFLGWALIGLFLSVALFVLSKLLEII